MCDLVAAGERSVNELAANVGLSQSALSQHLALLRDEGLVATRREGKFIYYSVAHPHVQILLETLHRLYCSAPAATPIKPLAKNSGKGS